MPPELATWLTKQAAADAIGVSTKTVEHLAQEGQLETALYRRPGGGARLRVYNPDDVARVAAARRTELGAFVLPAAPAEDPGSGIRDRHELVAQPAVPEALVHNLHTLLAAVLQVVTSENLLRSGETLFVDLTAAASITGLSRRRLLRFIREEKLQAVYDAGEWRVRRRDLEGL